MCKCYTVVAGDREIAGWMDGERERGMILVILFLLKSNLTSVLEAVVKGISFEL